MWGQTGVALHLELQPRGLCLACEDWAIYFFNFYPQLRTCSLILDRGKGERETPACCLSHSCRLGTKPATQACTLTGNQTHDLLVCGTMLQPTESGLMWSCCYGMKLGRPRGCGAVAREHLPCLSPSTEPLAWALVREDVFFYPSPGRTTRPPEEPSWKLGGGMGG